MEENANYAVPVSDSFGFITGSVTPIDGGSLPPNSWKEWAFKKSLIQVTGC